MSPAKTRTAAGLGILLALHAALAGGFLVAWLSGDEDTYILHQVAGYTVLAALALRLLAVPLARRGSLLRLPRFDLYATRQWLGRLLRGEAGARRQRSPLHGALALALLAGLGATTLSGIAADSLPALDAVHEMLGALALWVVLAHVAMVLVLAGLKRLTPPAAVTP